MKVEKEGSTLKYILYLIIALVAVMGVYWVYVSI